jgi:hypothetical protein
VGGWHLLWCELFLVFSFAFFFFLSIYTHIILCCVGLVGKFWVFVADETEGKKGGERRRVVLWSMTTAFLLLHIFLILSVRYPTT